MRMELFNSTSPIALLCNYDSDRDEFTLETYIFDESAEEEAA